MKQLPTWRYLMKMARARPWLYLPHALLLLLRAPNHEFLRKSLASVAQVSALVITKENELSVRSFIKAWRRGTTQ